MNFDLATVLPVLWFFIIGFAVLMYVLLDGFVLGIGILSPFADDEHQRDQMMNTAAPIWDGNETWLILGIAGLYSAFPRAYALILSTLYLPALLMMVGLVFRGIAFEFRFKAHKTRWVWGLGFHLGSLAVAFAQGVFLGALVEGMPLETGKYLGGAFGWFSPFAVMTGCALVFGYGLLGATWLFMKTDGRTQRIAADLARPLMMVVIAFMLMVSVWAPFINAQVMQRWFTWPNLLYLAPVPLLTALVAALLWRAVLTDREVQSFRWAMTLFVLGFIGLAVGIWPDIVPPHLTIWQAASPVTSLGFTLVGALLMIPVVLGYTVYSYRVFRGKVRAGEGYH